MNDLDDKLILKILNYVDIYDLIKNCKLVNKKFLNLINQIKFDDELILLNQKTFNVNTWYFNYNLINSKNVIPIKSNFLKTKLFKRKFKKIRSLKIDFPINRNNLLLDVLNCLKNLKHLEISFVKNLTKDIYLDLLNLEILTISHDVQIKFKFIINSDELKILKIDNLKYIKIKKPLTITNLELYQFHENVHLFKNLKILKISKLTSSLNKLQLSLLTQLTLLNLYASNLIDLNPNNFEFNCDKLKETYLNDLVNLKKGRDIINDLIRIKKINKRENLKIYLKGVLINKQSKFNKITFSMFAKQDFILHKENQGKLDNKFAWFNEIDYKQFTDCYQTKINFKRYFNIQIVNLIGEIEEPDKFLNFLSNCHNLSALTLYYTSFDSKIYNHLPLITKSITQIVIFEKDNIEIDYNFILEFKLLTNFYTNQQLNQELVDKILKNLKLIDSFRYELNDDIILKIQNYSGEYSTMKEKNNLKRSLNKDNLIQFLDDSINDTQINSKETNSINSDIEIKEIDFNNIKFLDITNDSIEIKEDNLESINSNNNKQINSQINILDLTINKDDSTNISEHNSTNSDLKYDSADDDLKYSSITENNENLKIYTSNEEIDLNINSIHNLKLEDNDDKNIDNVQKDNEQDNDQKEEYSVIVI